MGRGDVAGARADAESVLRVLPEDAQANAVLDEIALAERAHERLTRSTTEFAAGTPQALVDQLAQDVVAGRDARALAEAFDLEILGTEGHPTRADLASFVEGAMESWRSASARGDAVAFGWLVSPDTRREGDRAWVRVDVPMESVFTGEQKVLLERALREPSFRAPVDRTLLDAVLSLPPDQRAVVLAGLVGHRTRGVREVEVELARRGSRWRICDIVIGGVSVRANVPTFKSIARSTSDDRSVAYRFGQLLGYLLMIAVPVALYRRWKR